MECCLDSFYYIKSWCLYHFPRLLKKKVWLCNHSERTRDGRSRRRRRIEEKYVSPPPAGLIFFYSPLNRSDFILLETHFGFGRVVGEKNKVGISEKEKALFSNPLWMRRSPLRRQHTWPRAIVRPGPIRRKLFLLFKQRCTFYNMQKGGRSA